ncbi:MAG: SDR family oxidoreductase [Planctomycetes bacterium]|nr:SDR family oxidoreductase [Planctomycetota bacterium]
MAEPLVSLQGRRALVTGGARRLGRHLALELARAGADVYVHFLSSESEAASVVAEIQGLGREAWAVSADLGSPGGAEQLARAVLDRGSRLDILINNVGNYLVKPLADCGGDDFRAQLETNLIAPQILIRQLMEAMSPGPSWIVNLGYAGVENLCSHPEATAYQISKTGLFVLTKSWAEVLGARGVRVNMLSPGQLDNSVDLPDKIGAVIPLQRAGRMHDVWKALAFLLDSESYVTGVNIDVAGGYRL